MIAPWQRFIHQCIHTRQPGIGLLHSVDIFLQSHLFQVVFESQLIKPVLVRLGQSALAVRIDAPMVKQEGTKLLSGLAGNLFELAEQSAIRTVQRTVYYLCARLQKRLEQALPWKNMRNWIQRFIER